MRSDNTVAGDVSDRRGRFFAGTVFGMVTGDEHVNRRDNKQGKEGSDGHAAHQHQTDRVACSCTGSGNQCQREVTGDGGCGRHDNRAQAGQGGLVHGITFGPPLLLEFVGKFDNQDTVFRYQADKGY